MTRTGNSLFSFRGPFGVRVEVHSSVIFLGMVIVGLTGSFGDPAYGVTLFALLLLSIFLHEMGHAWGCVVQGVPVERVVIFGGGGFCQPAREATLYQSELIIAMGPIVNLGLWAAIGLAYNMCDSGLFFGSQGATSILLTFAAINLFLGALNLLPVLPLDGAKLLYYILARLLPTRAAMRITGAVGLTIALLWIPGMIWCFYIFGLVLIFFPSIAMQWRVFKAQTD